MRFRHVLALLAWLAVPCAAHAQNSATCTGITGLSRMLAQWQGALNKAAGSAILTLPSAGVDTDCADRARQLEKWRVTLEAWQKRKFLKEIPPAVAEDCRKTLELLTQWQAALETAVGRKVLQPPSIKDSCAPLPPGRRK